MLISARITLHPDFIPSESSVIPTCHQINSGLAGVIQLLFRLTGSRTRPEECDRITDAAAPPVNPSLAV